MLGLNQAYETSDRSEEYWANTAPKYAQEARGCVLLQTSITGLVISVLNVDERLKHARIGLQSSGAQNVISTAYNITFCAALPYWLGLVSIGKDIV